MKALLFVVMMFLGVQASAADCFNNSAVNSFENNGHDSVIVTSFKTKYQVDTFGCFNLEHADTIGFRPWAGFGSRICSGDDLLIIDQFTGRVLEQCRIDKVTKLK